MFFWWFVNLFQIPFANVVIVSNISIAIEHSAAIAFFTCIPLHSLTQLADEPQWHVRITHCISLSPIFWQWNHIQSDLLFMLMHLKKKCSSKIKFQIQLFRYSGDHFHNLSHQVELSTPQILSNLDKIWYFDPLLLEVYKRRKKRLPDDRTTESPLIDPKNFFELRFHVFKMNSKKRTIDFFAAI